MGLFILSTGKSLFLFLFFPSTVMRNRRQSSIPPPPSQQPPTTAFLAQAGPPDYEDCVVTTPGGDDGSLPTYEETLLALNDVPTYEEAMNLATANATTTMTQRRIYQNSRQEENITTSFTDSPSSALNEANLV